MSDSRPRAIAIVGVGAVLPDAPSAPVFWDNIRAGRYSISEVPAGRWDPELYYDPDPKAPDKTYSKIGGWVREWEWDPLGWKLPIPPKVSEAMDRTQKWAILAAREALADYGYPGKRLDAERTAVILGNAMAGDLHYLTAMRISFPEVARELAKSPTFGGLGGEEREKILAELHARLGEMLPPITEDTMPGELANIIAGRIANLFDFQGPNFIVDAACASAMAALGAAVEGLDEDAFDAVITGGIDANMSASTFTKFCKIGALSATGTRPYGEGADGFVMGEGAAVFLLKRLADAERDGDRIYAVIRALGGSSDGRGKGITAPNPKGQRLAVERAWARAGVRPDGATMIEGHGTSTRVGDVAEVESLAAAFEDLDLRPGSIPLGSVKSNIGHLKGAAGAAGILKAAFALRDKLLPASLGCERPNPNIDFPACPFFPNRELRDWVVGENETRRVGVSAFGFGGTNFHAVLEEHVPGRPSSARRATVATVGAERPLKPPLRGALALGAESESALAERVRAVAAEAASGRAPRPEPPAEEDLRAPVRIAIDFGDAAELAQKAGKALKALEGERRGMWRALKAQGVFLGEGESPRVAFLYTGQGSQYLNMLRRLREMEPIVEATWREADEVMTPFLGRPLSSFVFVDETDSEGAARAEQELRQTAITQPAVLTTDIALTRLFAAYGIVPDMVMGHSLGEYGALVAAGAISFAQALEAVSARGQAMTRIAVEDKGLMAAVFAPLDEVEEVLASIDGYVVVANINSRSQAVIGGATAAVEEAVARFRAAGRQTELLPVSHAFHTEIVAPASESLREVLAGLDLRPPSVPVVANLSGELYPSAPDAVPEMIDILARQLASPVQFVRGLETLYEAGVRIFVEVGPKRALTGMVADVLGRKGDVLALPTNHPRAHGATSFNHALCGLYAAGLGSARPPAPAFERPSAAAPAVRPPAVAEPPAPPAAAAQPSAPPRAVAPASPARSDVYLELGHLFADFLDRGFRVLQGRESRREEPVVITGASLGLPGTERVFDDENLWRLLRGEQFIGSVPDGLRREMLSRNIIRLVKSERGEPRFETITSADDVIKLAARRGSLDLVDDFGFPAERLPALDVVTELAIGAGLDALRDAGLPLVMRYRTTTKNTHLPVRWGLPDSLRDDTGVIFASAFPGADFFAAETERYFGDRERRRLLSELEGLRGALGGRDEVPEQALEGLDRRIADLREEQASRGYTFDRRFLFRLLAMGHSQFAELIGARGPNTQINSACASGTQAVALAEDWIRTGRCRRVLVISADDVTSDSLMGWIGAGFLASGAAATDERVEDAAIPFDRRRHGMIVGMGAAALVVESGESAAQRGLRPICEVLGTITANSAFHGTRLDVDHISGVMETLVGEVEKRWGLDRRRMAAETVFISHETYTPARGGSAQAEIFALRRVFGEAADRIVIANTKGYTGHPMGVAIEDVLAVKALETGVVPPVANFREIDPELGDLHLSRGGAHPVRYALRLGAGFGSQISMSLLRWVPSSDGARPGPEEIGYRYRLGEPEVWRSWLATISGDPEAETEVVRRTLRIRDRGPVAGKTPRAAAEPVTPAAPPAAAPVAPPVAPPAGVEDPVAVRVLEIVAAATGYPPEMLDPELDMEADLGIDTVKQAEVFAAIRQEWGIPRDDNLQLRDFPTLEHAVRFVYERRPDLERAVAAAPAAVATPAPAAPPVTPPPGIEDPVAARVLEIVAEATGYPPEMLDPELDMEADLGIDTVKQAEVFAAIREEWGIPRDDTLQLRDFPTLEHTVRFVHDRRPDLGRAAAPSTPAAPAGQDPVAARVLEIVAEATGYPPEMLDPELDMEADLGIDTVKQAEVFAAIREEWDIPRDDTLQLRDFPTLEHTVRFVHDRRPDLRDEPGPVPTAAAATEPEETPEPTRRAGEVLRRVPVAVARPGLELFRATGVTLAAGSRVVVMPDWGGVAETLIAGLRQRGVEVLVPEEVAGRSELVADLRRWLEEGPIQGVFWLPALDFEGEIEGMDRSHWRRELEVRVKLLHAVMRTLYEHVNAPGCFLTAAVRLDGRHGYGPEGAYAPMGGAVAGFTKAFRRERPEGLAKVVDFEPGAAPGSIAERLIRETLLDPGVVEVGYVGDQRWSVGVVERSVPDPDALPAPLDGDSVVVVTGAAGSIVSAIVGDLAADSGALFHLLDLAPEPDPADPDLECYERDLDELKRRLFARIQEAGERATPARIEREIAALERRHAALAAIRAIEQAGGRARYHQVDLLDGVAVAAVMEEVRRSGGRIDLLLHGAGLEISHTLPDKDEREFDLVFDVKSDGWFHLLSAAGDLPLAATVVFSSIAGRFGNAGQTDYSAANDLLCKMTSSLRRRRPEVRAIAIDWTAWAGIGMATRGSIPKMMEMAGIDMLPPEAGIPVVRRELVVGGGEVVVGGRLGVLAEEWVSGGGLDPKSLADPRRCPMVSSVIGLRLNEGLVTEAELDPSRQPFLNDHRIDGVPVLPGVMGIEAFAEAATLALPDWRIDWVEEVRFLAPFKLYRDEPRVARIEALPLEEDGALVAQCRLEGSRLLSTRSRPQVREHFRAKVRLASSAPGPVEAAPPAPPGERVIGADEIYRVYFHGPAYQVLELAWKDGERTVGRLTESLPAQHPPPERRELMAPRLIELCLQTAGLLEMAEHQRMGLPHSIERVRVLRDCREAKGRIYALVEKATGGGSYNARVVDDAGRVLLELEGYATVEVPWQIDARLQAALERVFG